MKNKFMLTPICILGCIATQLAAVADETPAKTNETKAADSPDSPVISLSAKIESRLSLYNTASSSRVHFFQEIARLGANVSYGKVTGKIYVGFQGNSLNSSSQSTAPESKGEAGVREAWLAYSIIKKQSQFELSYQVGRFLPNAASVYGADPTSNYWAGAGNFDSVDGMALNANISQGIYSVTLQAVGSSAMPVYVFNSTDAMNSSTNTLGSLDSSFGNGPNNNKISMIGSIQANIKPNDDLTLEGAFAYGKRSKSRIGTDPNAPSANSPTYISADLTYFEGSAGIKYKSLALGGWYSQASLSSAVSWTQDSKTPADVTTSSTNYNASPDITTSYKVYGVGFQGDSTIFGLKDLAAKNDTLIYGIGAQWISNSGFRNSANTSGVLADSSSNDTFMLSEGGGYQNGIFTTTLNYAYFKSQNDVYQKDDTSKGNLAQRLYIMTSLAL